MPQDDTTGIKDMINALINDDQDKANEHFHSVLQAKMQSRINPTPAAADADDTDTDPDAGGAGE